MRPLSFVLGLAFIFTPFSAVLAEDITVPVPVSTEEVAVPSVDVVATTTPVEVATSTPVTEGASVPEVQLEASTTTPIEATSTPVTGDDIEEIPSIEDTGKDYSRMPFTIPTNDTFKNDLWALENTGQKVNGDASGTPGDDIDALPAWDISSGTSTIVAVIDTGVFYTHADLATNMWDGRGCVDDHGHELGGCVHGYDAADNDLDPMPVATSTKYYAHGTHIAGIIAAERNNGTGVIGIAPSAKIMAIRFDLTASSSARAIDFARMNGAKVINASYGGSVPFPEEYQAIKRFTEAGGIFVAAAGNSNTATNTDSDVSPMYPAAYDLPGIISVAATDQNDDLASFSYYGTTNVDLGAPGVSIYSTYVSTSTNNTLLPDKYSFADGTSMSAPYVAGTVALIKSKYPYLSNEEVKKAVLDGGDAVSSLNGITVSGKRLNAYGALVAAGIDLTPPVITLNGPSSIVFTVGNSYTEPGAMAFDTHDGTTTVTMIGGDVISTSTPVGTYTITYDAVDSAGNHATQVTRTITVSAVVISSGGGGGGGGGSSSSSSKKKNSKTVKKTVANPPRAPLASYTELPAPTVVATSTVPTASFTLTLSLGSTGTEVSALQQALTRAGVYTGPVTGYFGPLTQAGVRSYQAKHLLPQVGVVGPMTRALLNQGL